MKLKYFFYKYLEDSLGSILNIEEVDGGIKNHVYKITTPSKSVYLKISDNHYVKIPTIKCNPKNIIYEKKSIELLSKHFPNIFPQLLDFNSKYNMILMSDVNHTGKTLDKYFDELVDHEIVIRNLGSMIGTIHKKLSNFILPIRNLEEEEKVYGNNLYYRLGYHNNPQLNTTINLLKSYPKQLILGDLSPKNIGINSHSKITLVDLEKVHLGNIIFDVGFICGHITIHNINKLDYAHKLIRTFLLAYFKSNKVKFNNEILKNIYAGTILYRLSNEDIPYSLPNLTKLRRTGINYANNCLQSKSATWLEE